MCRFCSSQGKSGEFNRREALLTMASTGVAAGLMHSAVFASTAEAPAAPPASDALDVRVVYLRPKAKYWLGWPGTAWDPEGFVKKSLAQVEKFGKELGIQVTCEPEPLYDAASVDQFIAKVKAEKPKGVIVFPLHMEEWGEVDKIAQSGIPTVIFAGLGTCFTGHIATTSRRPGVYLASSSDFELTPVRFGMKMIKTAYRVRHTKVAVLRGTETAEQVLEPFGLTIRYLPRKLFPDTLKTIGETPEVLAMAEDAAKKAKKVVEPTHSDLVNAAKNYYTALKIMKDEGCQGISMDCLGLVADRQIPTPPCLAWARFLDTGMTGCCEADLNGVMSHELCCKLLDKPGFMQDPVPDTVNNTFIGAHCVCPTRLDGFDKPAEPFILRSHAESNLGVAVQVLFRANQEVTIMQFVGPGKMILGKGKVLRNLDTPPCGGCRTSVELAIDAPADTRDTKGFHQLFIYGNHMRDFQAYGQMYGIATEHV
jgi:hypothetical protein